MKLSELDPCLWQSYPELPASTSGIDFPDIHNDTFAELKPLPPFDYSPNPITNNCTLAAVNSNNGGSGGGGSAAGGGGGLASLLSSSALSTTTTLLEPTSGNYDVSTTTSNIKTELAEYLLNSDIDDIAALIGSAIAEQQQQQINPASEVSSSTIDPWTELDAWIESACQQPNISPCLEQDSTIHTTDYNLPSLVNDYGFTTSSPILQARLQSSPQQLPESTTTSLSSSNNSNSPNFTNLKVEPGYNTHIEPHVSPTSTTPGLGNGSGNGTGNNMTVRYGSNGQVNGNQVKVFSASPSGRQHLFSIPIGNSMGSQANANGNHPHSQPSHPQAHHLHQHHHLQGPGHLQHAQHHHMGQQHPHSMQPHNGHNGVGPGNGSGGARAKKDQRRMDKNSPNTNSGAAKLPSFPSFYTLQQKVKKRTSKKSLSSLSPPSIHLSTSPSSSSLSPPQNGGVGSTSSAGAASSSSSNGSHHLGGSLASSAATSSSLSDLSDKEKPIHRCNICSRGFLNKSNIKVHLRTHTGEKPFKCDVCSKSFRQKAHLLKHVQIHKRIPRD